MKEGGEGSEKGTSEKGPGREGIMKERKEGRQAHNMRKDRVGSGGREWRVGSEGESVDE